MTRGVQLGGSEDVGESIVVGLDHELRSIQLIPQLIHPLQGQELKFVHGIVLLGGGQVPTHVGNRP